MARAAHEAEHFEIQEAPCPPGSSRRNISAAPGHEIEPPGLAIRGGAHILDARRSQKVVIAFQPRHCLNESAPARLCRASRGLILQRRWSRRHMTHPPHNTESAEAGVRRAEIMRA